MAKRYIVSRVMHCIQSTAIFADNESEAIEKSRKLLRKDWKTLDAKKRTGYTAQEAQV